MERNELLSIFAAAVKAADPAHAVAAHMPDEMPIPDEGGTLAVIALGKAAPSMMAEAIRHSPDCLTRALVVTHEAAAVQDGCGLIVGGHPVPDKNSEAAGSAILEMVAPLGAGDRVLALVSGGGSALAVAPKPPVTLADKIKLNRLLLENGYDINETNEVRQAVSELKGGGLTRAAYPAPVTALVLSDVIGDDLRAVASGPTVGPIGSAKSAAGLLAPIFDQLPNNVQKSVRATAQQQKPVPAARNILVGSNAQSVAAAAAYGGLRPLPEPVTGDVSAAAQYLLSQTEASFTAGGETTVIVRGTGKGGRNQELALRFACLAQSRLTGNWRFLSAGTDGRDGPTDAAGAIVGPGTLGRIAAAGIDADASLANNDAYSALDAAGDLIRMPATGTNVADIQIFVRW